MKWLKDIYEKDIAEAGRKAYVLADLKRCGFPVPDGFVITDSLCRRMFFGSAVACDEADPQKLIEHVELPLDICSTIVQGSRKLGLPVVVRSSAANEDTPGLSYAGLYETVLNATSETDIIRAIRICWSSLFSERLRDYANRHGVLGKDLKLSLLVQKQIQPEVSGVMFTANPVTGNDRETVVEAVPGLGDALVSGRAQPDRYCVDTFSGKIIKRNLSHSEPRDDACYEGGAHPTTMQSSTPRIDDATLLDLVRLGLSIQIHYGCPQDVEWAVADGQIYILQARPITRISYRDIPGEWTTADFRDGGVASDVVTPFMWSLYENVWESIMWSYLREIHLAPKDATNRWSRVFWGRPYWNVGAVKKSLAKLPGFRERNFDEDLGIEITYEGVGYATPFRWKNLLHALLVLLALEKIYFTQKRKAQTAVTEFEQYEKQLMSQDITAMSDDELRAAFVDLVHRRHFDIESAYFKTIFATTNSRLEFKKALDAANKKGAQLEFLPLITSLEPLKTFRPLHELWKISRSVGADAEQRQLIERGDTKKIWAHPVLCKELRKFLDSYGHHSARELDLKVPRWDEDPEPVIEVLRRYVQLDENSDPHIQILENRKRHEHEMEKLGSFLSRYTWIRKKLLLRKLKRVRFYTWYREEVRDSSTRMYRLVRRMVLEIGRRLYARGILNQVDDIFCLTCQDIEACFPIEQADVTEVRGTVETRRDYLLSFRNFENPNEMGSRWQYRRDDITQKIATRSVYKGIPCAPGKKSGRIKILKGIGQSSRLERGDILVTRFTDPGWTPLFPLVSGVITETGGILSHAAIIAREYGIPAVLAVRNATTIIPENQLAVVDGDRGEVLLC